MTELNEEKLDELLDPSFEINRNKLLNDANFAVILQFFEKFSEPCGIEPRVDSEELINWLLNSDEVSPELQDLHVKLLRKLRKSVHAPKWERALIKFCYTYSNQDAWEIERFGYKKASLSVKLRILKSLLEQQFDLNQKFKTAINNIKNAKELRNEPIGRDKFGNDYWCMLDDKCNLRIFQENADDETWKIVAGNREELVKLIEMLKRNAPIKPNLEDLIDEDSSSNSVSVKLEVKPNVAEEEYSIKQDPNNDGTSLKQTIKITKKLEKSESIDSEVASKASPKNEFNKRVTKETLKTEENNTKKIKCNIKLPEKDDDECSGEFEEIETEEEDELNEEGAYESDDNDDEIGEEIEEPVMHIRGEGSGKDCEGGNPEFSDVIEEEIIYFYGEGSGHECLVGNTGKEENESKDAKQPQMFFFGQPGCLKNSPTVTTPEKDDSKKITSLVDYDTDSTSSDSNKNSDSKLEVPESSNHKDNGNNGESVNNNNTESVEIEKKDSNDTEPSTSNTQAAIVDDDEDKKLLEKISQALESESEDEGKSKVMPEVKEIPSVPKKFHESTAASIILENLQNKINKEKRESPNICSENVESKTESEKLEKEEEIVECDKNNIENEIENNENIECDKPSEPVDTPMEISVDEIPEQSEKEEITDTEVNNEVSQNESAAVEVTENPEIVETPLSENVENEEISEILVKSDDEKKEEKCSDEIDNLPMDISQNDFVLADDKLKTEEIPIAGESEEINIEIPNKEPEQEVKESVEKEIPVEVPEEKEEIAPEVVGIDSQNKELEQEIKEELPVEEVVEKDKPVEIAENPIEENAPTTSTEEEDTSKTETQEIDDRIDENISDDSSEMPKYVEDEETDIVEDEKIEEKCEEDVEDSQNDIVEAVSPDIPEIPEEKISEKPLEEESNEISKIVEETEEISLESEAVTSETAGPLEEKTSEISLEQESNKISETVEDKEEPPCTEIETKEILEEEPKELEDEDEKVETKFEGKSEEIIEENSKEIPTVETTTLEEPEQPCAQEELLQEMKEEMAENSGPERDPDSDLIETTSEEENKMEISLTGDNQEDVNPEKDSTEEPVIVNEPEKQLEKNSEEVQGETEPAINETTEPAAETVETKIDIQNQMKPSEENVAITETKSSDLEKDQEESMEINFNDEKSEKEDIEEATENLERKAEELVETILPKTQETEAICEHVDPPVENPEKDIEKSIDTEIEIPSNTEAALVEKEDKMNVSLSEQNINEEKSESVVDAVAESAEEAQSTELTKVEEAQQVEDNEKPIEDLLNEKEDSVEKGDEIPFVEPSYAEDFDIETKQEDPEKDVVEKLEEVEKQLEEQEIPETECLEVEKTVETKEEIELPKEIEELENPQEEIVEEIKTADEIEEPVEELKDEEITENLTEKDFTEIEIETKEEEKEEVKEAIDEIPEQPKNLSINTNEEEEEEIEENNETVDEISEPKESENILAEKEESPEKDVLAKSVEIGTAETDSNILGTIDESKNEIEESKTSEEQLENVETEKNNEVLEPVELEEPKEPHEELPEPQEILEETEIDKIEEIEKEETEPVDLANKLDAENAEDEEKVTTEAAESEEPSYREDEVEIETKEPEKVVTHEAKSEFFICVAADEEENVEPIESVQESREIKITEEKPETIEKFEEKENEKEPETVPEVQEIESQKGIESLELPTEETIHEEVPVEQDQVTGQPTIPVVEPIQTVYEKKETEVPSNKEEVPLNLSENREQEEVAFKSKIVKLDDSLITHKLSVTEKIPENVETLVQTQTQPMIIHETQREPKHMIVEEKPPANALGHLQFLSQMQSRLNFEESCSNANVMKEIVRENQDEIPVEMSFKRAKPSTRHHTDYRIQPPVVQESKLFQPAYHFPAPSVPNVDGTQVPGVSTNMPYSQEVPLLSSSSSSSSSHHLQTLEAKTGPPAVSLDVHQTSISQERHSKVEECAAIVTPPKAAVQEQISVVEDLSEKKSEEPLELSVNKSEPKDSPNKSTSLIPANRKRRLSEEKPMSASSDSESDVFSHSEALTCPNDEDSSEEVEEVAAKKPKIREKMILSASTRNKSKLVKENKKSPEKAEEVEPPEEKSVEKLEKPEKEIVNSSEISKKEPEEQKITQLTFDYNPDDEIHNVSKEALLARAGIPIKPKPESEKDANEDPLKSGDEDQSDEESTGRSSKRRGGRRGKRKGSARRGPVRKQQKNDETVSEDDKPATEKKKEKSQDESSPDKSKKRGQRGMGLLRHIDTSLVIDTTESETPVRQSRRIAQQKIREETERRQMEERLLKQMKEEAERKKLKVEDVPEPMEEESPEEDSKDVDYKGKKKKKKKAKPLDRPWQTDSSDMEQHTEPEEEDDLERVVSDRGSPLVFQSDHEFSMESDVEDGDGQIIPTKRARTAKKEDKEDSDSDEDVNPDHACQVCKKTDHPEWILLCDSCDHGYHCSCLKPVLFLIPEGDWFCPLCQHKRLIENLEQKLVEFDEKMHELKAEEQRQKMKALAEISEANILAESRKEHRKSRESSKRRDSSSSDEDSKNSGSSSDSSSDNTSDNEPIYKLRRRAQTNVSYRFNDYDALIYSAIRDEMEEVKGAGNAGRGKDISTIIEADKEEKKAMKRQQEIEGRENEELPENEEEEEEEEKPEKLDESAETKEEESQPEKPVEKKRIRLIEDDSDSDVVRKPSKSKSKKKKSKKLNNLDFSSEEDQVSDEDFKGSYSSDSDDSEAFSEESVSESSLDLPRKKGKHGKGRVRSTRTRKKRFETTFINDNDSSDDEPLIVKKRKKNKSDSEDYELDLDEDDSEVENVNSEDLCDDTETESSDSNWPKKKKRRVASYDKKPVKRKPKKPEDEDKAFRAGISKKKVQKTGKTIKSETEESSAESSGSTGKRRTRGKKLFLLDDDLESSDDGIKPGVKRPDTPPEERALFIQKQEEIKRMLAEKNKEGAQQLAAPKIEPIKIALNKPPPPPLIPAPPIADSLSTIPKNIIEGAKALDTDYNKIKPVLSSASNSNTIDTFNPDGMNEEELAKMMEEEDFAQHQLKLAGEAIARSKKMRELEAKKEEDFFAPKESEKPADSKKRKGKAQKDKDVPPMNIVGVAPVSIAPVMPPVSLPPGPSAGLMPSSLASLQNFSVQQPSKLLQSLQSTLTSPGIPPHSKPGMMQHFPPNPLMMKAQGTHPTQIYGTNPALYTGPQRLPPPTSLLSAHLQQSPMEQMQRIPTTYHQPLQQAPPPMIPSSVLNLPPQPGTAISPSSQVSPTQLDDKKRGRRKKFTPLRSDLPNDPNQPPSVLNPEPKIMPSIPAENKPVDVKASEAPKLSVAAPPQLFNPAAAGTTPSVITRLLQPQIPPSLGIPYGQAAGAASRIFQAAQMKHGPPTIENPPRGPPPNHYGPPPNVNASHLPTEPHYNPRSVLGAHPLYRPPQSSIYGLPPGARLPYHGPPSSLHNLHATGPPTRTGPPEYQGPPYGVPPQFSYFAPQPPVAHRTRPPQNEPIDLNSQTAATSQDSPTQAPQPESQNSGSSEFSGLVSYFSSQHELD